MTGKMHQRKKKLMIYLNGKNSLLIIANSQQNAFLAVSRPIIILNSHNTPQVDLKKNIFPYRNKKKMN
jgi:hypothetical protein